MEHLIFEVLAYAADEAESMGRRGRGIVTLHGDGSVSVADDGRGTDTRVDGAGRAIKKPVMGTKDCVSSTTPVLRRRRPEPSRAANWTHLYVELVDERPS